MHVRSVASAVTFVRRGFTLVELLVVIGIIALLVAILLPVLSRARQQAQVTVCAARLQQHATALHLYAMDNKKGYLPRFDTGLTGMNLWDVSNDYYDTLNKKFRQPHRMFFCPLAEPSLEERDYKQFNYFTLIAYALWVPRLNGGRMIPPAPPPDPGASGFSFPTGVKPTPIRGPVRLGEKLASSNPTISDIVSFYQGFTPAADDAADLEKYHQYINWYYIRHIWRNRPDSINVAYADGHVERVPPRLIRPRYFGNWWNWR